MKFLALLASSFLLYQTSCNKGKNANSTYTPRVNSTSTNASDKPLKFKKNLSQAERDAWKADHPKPQGADNKAGLTQA